MNLNEDSIEELERKHARYEAWKGITDMLIMPVVFLSLGALSLVTVNQQALPTIVMPLPLVPMVGALFAMKASHNRIRRSREAIAAYYQRKFLKTRWRTVADAEGVVIGVSTFGHSLTLAFENGVKESYDRSMLTEVTQSL